jgi:hypothetical protein
MWEATTGFNSLNHTLTISNPTSSNLLLNPGFESGTTNWTTTGGTLNSITSPKRSGSKAISVKSRTASYHGPRQDIKSALNSNGIGNYYFEAWVRMASGISNANIAVVYNGNYLETSNFAVNSTSWVKVSGDLNMSWIGSVTDAYIYIQTTSGTTEIRIDDCVMLRNSALKSGLLATGLNPISNDENEILLFPNPVKDKLNIEGFSPNTRITVYDNLGSKLKEESIIGSHHEIDVANFSPGVYFVKSSQNKIHQFIKIE